jgi:uncharacterized membrane protein (UPF0127 family)
MKLQIINATRSAPLCNACEEANTAQKQRNGLLGKTSLQPGEGMLIPWTDSVHTYGMQFPIDLLFLDGAVIIDCVSDFAPGGQAKRDGAKAVLELPAGMIEATGTQKGDSLAFSPAGMSPSFIPGCRSFLELLESYKVVKPGTTAAIDGLWGHAKKFAEGLQGVRR